MSHKIPRLVPCLLAFWAVLLFVAPEAVASTVSYDSDGDGLIEISTLAQLNAVRWDLDGDGAVDNNANAVVYSSAFPNAVAGMGCPTTTDDADDNDCTGYELAGNLDFDTDGDGDVDVADEYWNSGVGWAPIGGYAAAFEGNVHTIANLYINRSSGSIGLFGSVSAGGQVRNVGVRDLAVTGSGESWAVGGLVGLNQGSIVSSYATGSVRSWGGGSVGGLVGHNGRHRSTGSIAFSYTTTMVRASGESRSAGGLVGFNGGSGDSRGSIVSSYATGAVTALGESRSAGGLVGFNGGSGDSRGSIVSSYATGSVTAPGTNSDVGGLVGFNGGSGDSRGSIVSSYATGSVTAPGTNSDVGGLVGFNGGSGCSIGSIVSSYATGSVAAPGTNSDVGGLVGFNGGGSLSRCRDSSRGTIVDSYWNTETSGQASSGGDAIGKTTVELQTPTGYSGIFANWNRDLDGDGTADDPWDFGTASEYPVVRVDFDGDGDVDADDVDPQRLISSPPASIPVSTVSYDTDGDGLIEISTLAQLNAIRWDLDGDGAVDNGTNRVAYTTAFSDAASSMGCALADHDGHSATPDVPVCTGYELNADLDFDTDGDGDVDATDAYWNRSRGWEPIGSFDNEFIATFDGNVHTISHLYISRSSSRIGLFGVVGNGGRIRDLGVVDVDVKGSSRGGIVGGLAGKNAGIITGSHVTGSVTSTGDGSDEVGGLAGRNNGSIVASYAAATVTGPGSSFRSRVGGLAGYNYGSIRASYASGTVTGTGNQSYVGGLVGLHNGGSIRVSYATGSVNGNSIVGGLVGQNDVSIWASFATGSVTGNDYVGGLVGYNQSGYIRASFATGWVTGTGSNLGGLVGSDQGSGVSNSYWNTTTSGRVSSAAGEGKTTAELQAPSGYAGIYASWDLDLDNADGDRNATTGGDDPWDFGTAQQYPALQADFNGDGTATWQEFGEQRPDAATPTDGGSPDDATLKALGVSPVDIEGFSADVLSYHIGVGNEVSQVTVTPYSNDDGATIDINGSSVSSGSGHAVSLAEGSNEITITVTARDGTTTREYTITADRGSDAAFGWKVTDDFQARLSFTEPYGIWSNGTTMWVMHTSLFFRDPGEHSNYTTLQAYGMSTKEQGVSFHTLKTWGNDDPLGIASDGTTMWVVDHYDGKIYAYRMSNYSRNLSKEINGLALAGITKPRGIAVEPVLGGFWVADDTNDKLYAYNRHTLRRIPDADFNTLAAAGNNDPTGIWTDGTTMWVADSQDAKLYAYDRSSKARVPSKDFNTLSTAGNKRPWGIWSDGETMWVADYWDRIFSYNMPNRTDATLRGLTVIPDSITGFSPDVTAYHVGVGNDVTQVWVMPTLNLSGGTIDLDGSSVVSGSAHSVSLSEGRNDVTITVTADDRRTTKVYTVTVGRSDTTTYGWNAVADFNTLNAADNDYPTGLWSDGTTMWVVDTADKEIIAYNLNTKARDVAKDIDALDAAGNTSPRGVWSDGTTIWVSDPTDDKLYAYGLSTAARDAPKDFGGLGAAGNEYPTGIWSDGTTMWVVDTQDDKIYAYGLTTKARDAANDFNALNTLSGGNRSLGGIWSDGSTMWLVVDRDVHVVSDDKVYAYDMATRTRDSTRDFEGLDAAGNEEPSGIWSDGTTLWVANYEQRSFNNAGDRIRYYSSKIYAYNIPSSGAAAAATDFNGDGKTDFVDFFLFADAFGGTDASFDLDGNGRVDFADFFKFVDAFGS